MRRSTRSGREEMEVEGQHMVSTNTMAAPNIDDGSQLKSAKRKKYLTILDTILQLANSMTRLQMFGLGAVLLTRNLSPAAINIKENCVAGKDELAKAMGYGIASFVLSLSAFLFSITIKVIIFKLYAEEAIEERMRGKSLVHMAIKAFMAFVLVMLAAVACFVILSAFFSVELKYKLLTDECVSEGEKAILNVSALGIGFVVFLYLAAGFSMIFST